MDDQVFAAQIPENPAAAEFPAQPWTNNRNDNNNTLTWSGPTTVDHSSQDSSQEIPLDVEIPGRFKNQVLEVDTEEPLKSIWERLRRKDTRLPEFTEVGLTPRSISLEMKVTMLKKDVMVVIGAVINRNWEQGKTQVGRLRSPEKDLADCVSVGSGIFRPERYTLEDGRPWKDNNVLTAVPGAYR
jgi:hypothetical protein